MSDLGKYLWRPGAKKAALLNARGKQVQRKLWKSSKATPPLDAAERNAVLGEIAKRGSAHAPAKQAKRPTGRSAQWRANTRNQRQTP